MAARRSCRFAKSPIPSPDRGTGTARAAGTSANSAYPGTLDQRPGDDVALGELRDPLIWWWSLGDSNP